LNSKTACRFRAGSGDTPEPAPFTARATLAVALLLSGGCGTAGGPAPAIRQNAQSLRELRVLEEILASRNDNDSRLDTGFNGLSPETKALFRQKYASLPAEARNERGTIVYIIGKNLSQPEDWVFLEEVVREKPCLSLQNCAAAAPAPDHEQHTVSVTLAYPALVALRQAGRAAGGGDNRRAVAVAEAARLSESRTISNAAVRLELELLRPAGKTP